MATETFGEVIKKARKSWGLTLRKLAEDVGISHPYLSQLENGRNDKPSPTVVLRLADALDIPFAYLLILTNDNMGLGEISDQELETLKSIKPIDINSWDTFEEFQERFDFDGFGDDDPDGNKMKKILTMYQYLHSLKMTEKSVRYQVELEDVVKKTNEKLSSPKLVLTSEKRVKEVSLEDLLNEDNLKILVNKKPLNDEDKKKLIALTDILFNTK